MAESLGARFRLVQELHEPAPTSAFFLARVLDEGRRELRTERWATAERSLGQLGIPLMRSAGDGGETVVLERDGALVLISLHSGFVYAQAATADERGATASGARCSTTAAGLQDRPLPECAGMSLDE